jgi:hypothetical protein
MESAAVSTVEVAILSLLIARRQRLAWHYPNPTRERGTNEGRRRKRRKSIPHLRFGLGQVPLPA